MMQTYKLTLCPRSSFRTPLQADTLWGHLMWALRYVEGESQLESFLARYKAGSPPLLISAGFPSGMLPAPLLLPKPPERPGVAYDAVMKLLTEQADLKYLPLSRWETLVNKLSGETFQDALPEPRLTGNRSAPAKARLEVITHTAIDRITGGAREGQLFKSEETFYGPEARFDVWMQIENDADLPDRIRKCWRWVEFNGFGKRKTAGKGAFTIAGSGLEKATLPQAKDPNGFMSLSTWVPRQGDPTDVVYKMRVKRGKMAETYAEPSPWKKPLLMLIPGTVARLPKGAAPRPYYGGLVGDMHWNADYNHVLQYGYALPLPLNWVTQEER